MEIDPIIMSLKSTGDARDSSIQQEQHDIEFDDHVDGDFDNDDDDVFYEDNNNNNKEEEVGEQDMKDCIDDMFLNNAAPVSKANAKSSTTYDNMELPEVAFDQNDPILLVVNELMKDTHNKQCDDKHDMQSRSIIDLVSAAVSDVFPKVDINNPQCVSLIMAITRTVAKKCPQSVKGLPDDRRDCVTKICKSLMDQFPRRPLFNLMSRWSRKKAYHWQKDAINVIVVMANQLQVTPIKFLTTARTWKLLPPNQERSKTLVRYVRQDQKNQKQDQIVERLHASLLMLHCDVLGIEDLIMGRIRMAAVDTSTTFEVMEGCTSKSTNVDDNDDELVCDDSNNGVGEKTRPTKPNTHYVGSPLQGFHMFRSFEKRTWLTVEHVHLGLLLTELIFQPSIHQLKLFDYTSCLSHQALAFWYKVSSECSQHNAYVALLAQICILFPDEKSISSNKKMIHDLSSKPDQFYNNVYEYAKRRHDVTLIKKNFDSIRNKAKSFSFSSRMKIDEKLQTIAYVTFKYYILSKKRIQLKRSVEGVSEIVVKQSNKKQKSTTATATGQHVPLAFSVSNKIRTSCNICSLYTQLPMSTAAAASTSIHEPTAAASTRTNAAAPITSSYEELANDQSQWIGCKIATQESINAKVKSSLVVDVGTHYYKIDTAAIEIYSCGKLKERCHWRETHSATDDTSLKSTTTVITQDVIEFIDPFDNCHVVRLDSEIFKNALDQNLQDQFDLVGLMRHTMRHGVADKRKDLRGYKEHTDSQPTTALVTSQLVFVLEMRYNYAEHIFLQV